MLPLKLRRAQNAIIQMRPYAAKLKEILQNLSASLDAGDDGSIYADQREPKNVLIVVVSSNRGLCGAFNANIIKEANKLINKKYKSQLDAGNLSMMTIGRKVTEYFEKNDFTVISSHDEIYDTLTFEQVSVLAQNVMDRFEEKKFDRVEIIYNQFKNAATQNLVAEQFLPVEPVAARRWRNGNFKSGLYFRTK